MPENQRDPVLRHVVRVRVRVSNHGLFADGVDVVDVDTKLHSNRHCTYTTTFPLHYPLPS